MRYLKLIPILLVASGMFLPCSLSAQEHKRVEVTTIYTPEIAVATKLDVPATIVENNEMEPDIVYNIYPETWQIKLEDHNFKPATASYWDFNRAEHFYTRLSAGFPLISAATLRYMTQNVRVGYFGVGVEHDGSFSQRKSGVGVVRSVADSYDMRNRASVKGGVMAGNQMFEGNITYDCDIFNRYATISNPSRLYLHDANVSLRYGDAFADLSRLNFSVEAHGGYWSHVPPSQADANIAASEFNAGGAVCLMRDFSDNVIGLDVEYDMWQSKSTSYRDIRFGASVQYVRDFDIVRVDASLGYLYDRVRNRAKASHFILPRLRLDFDLGIDALQPYVDVNTTVSNNSVAQLYDHNPFIDYDYSLQMLSTMPNTRSYDISAGIAGVAFSSRLAYRAYIGGNFMRDQVLWYINNIGTFGISAANNNRLFFGAEVEYRPVGGLSIGASFVAHSDNSVGEYVTSDARMRGSVDIRYNIKRWKFYVSGDLTGRRRWSAIEGDEIHYEAFVAPTIFDLGVGVSFKASNRVEIFVDGYNLLNQQMFDYAYYYRNGIGGMAGVKIEF